jgi:hypothetical protein
MLLRALPGRERSLARKLPAGADSIERLVSGGTAGSGVTGTRLAASQASTSAPEIRKREQSLNARNSPRLIASYTARRERQHIAATSVGESSRRLALWLSGDAF